MLRSYFRLIQLSWTLEHGRIVKAVKLLSLPCFFFSYLFPESRDCQRTRSCSAPRFCKGPRTIIQSLRHTLNPFSRSHQRMSTSSLLLHAPIVARLDIICFDNVCQGTHADVLLRRPLPTVNPHCFGSSTKPGLSTRVRDPRAFPGSFSTARPKRPNKRRKQCCVLFGRCPEIVGGAFKGRALGFTRSLQRPNLVMGC